MCLLQDNAIDIAFITETWLSDHANTTTAEIKSYGYKIIHDYRSDVRGGGAALLFKCSLQYNPVDLRVSNITTFEYITGSLTCTPDMKVLFICIYRTGAVSKKFFNDLDSILSDACLKSDYVILAGDFNIHVETINENSTELLQITSSYGFSQIVDQPTHINGGTIDLFFDNSNLLDISTLNVEVTSTLSDHFPVICSTKNFITNLKKPKTITIRDLKSVDNLKLSTDLMKCISEFKLSGNFMESCSNFFTRVKTTLDKHAPLVSKVISYVPHAPWFDSEYKNQRKLRRKAERKKDKSVENRILFEKIRAETSILANTKKKQYYNRLLEKNKDDVRCIFNIVNSELDRKQDVPLPAGQNLPELSKNFNQFFNNKILKIRENFPVNTAQYSVPDSESFESESYLNAFAPCSEDELRNIIKDSGIKCAPADFLPTSVLKDNIELFVPLMCKIVNQSLSEGSIDGLKIADVIPTLKDQKLDPNDFKSYRPISNLSFLGKITERVVLSRLNDHLNRNNLNIPQESAYKKFHSTETILLKVTNDLLIACDSKSATVLMMLDLSAAFDTVDHHMLIKILFEEIRIRGVALKWFKSFLMGRSQRTRLGSVTSDTIILEFGVPQGSVLGPILFNVYIRSLYKTIEKFGFQVQGYADDHQIYKSFKACDHVDVLTIQIINCFKTIQQWMVHFCLQLNPGKTQLIVVGPPQVLNQLHIGGVILSTDICVRFVSSVRNLGITMDSNMSFESQIMSLKKASFRLIRNVVKRRFLFSTDQMKLVVNSIIACKLDYCNALYIGVSDNLIYQLQLIQNAAAKAIVGLYKHDHLGNILKELHWLPVYYRIQFKILLLVYKCLNGMGPDYLSSMLKFANFNHFIHLTEPRVHTSYGERSFQKIGPKLWNMLPLDIKTCLSLDSFKCSLKTHLFTVAFNLDT